ncbi:secretin and TonB N-terminal domain-containing protein [Paraburkholderia sp. D15]|uniref:secretin and TonB N-terminal domain-containing protein n=1 Tax=Paraburkholderia sp. D15 TaxID=2880218 RepID=UPI002478E132|nr:secretin and TonB N-terminal domain-containing protein [Paraburkholderia sp. D15]WGS48380.1 secretin and TonB N-terminal domain-containing protein [Paraburkholderia sp. D15]
MTRSRAPSGVLALTACLLALTFVTRHANAQDAGQVSPAAARALHFDLPGQPLAQALQAFARTTELIVLAPAPLLDGRTSAPVTGDYAPRDALERVLAGTGLQAEFTGQDEAIIVARPAAPEVASAVTADAPADAALPIDGLGDDADARAYAGMLQARMTQALCALPAAMPGGYRLAAQLRIDNKGAVVGVNLVASSGQNARDAAIVHALRSLRLDAAPPDGLPEPVTILLRPTGNGVHLHCPTTDGRN